MEITNFITSETLTTFLMAIVIVELWVSFSKDLIFIKKIPTKFYTFIITTIHLFIINISTALFTWDTSGIYALLCNALIISVMLCGGYDIATNKITINSQENVQDKEES